MNYAQELANEFNIRESHATNIINLIEEGNTIPFIARYRKEMTGSIDDQVLRDLADRYSYLKNLEKRKGEIISSITEQGKMTDELLNQIQNAVTQTELEDIYRPYKPKRKTRASEAIKKGLQPLADIILEQKEENIEDIAKNYITEDIKIEQDIIEEIARMYGLENFEAKPLKLDLISLEHENIYNQEYEVKDLLATKFDLHEVNSYMWYDTETLKKLGVAKDGVKLLGKSENNILRDDLSFSLMNIVDLNFKNYHEFGIFEIATIIQNNENKRVLSVIIAADEKNIADAYMNAKAITKYLFKVLKNKDVEFTNNVNEYSYYDKNLGKIISVDNINIGTLNVLDKGLTNKLAKKKVLVCLDIDFDKYVTIVKEPKFAEAVSKYPTVEFDYTIIMPENTKYENLHQVLKEFRSNLIKSYSLVSIYENKYTIRYILGSNTKTLEQKDLQTFQNRFLEHLKNNNYNLA